MSVPAANMNAGIRGAVEQGIRTANGDTDATEAEKDAVKKLFTEYSQARTFDKTARQGYSVDRRYAAGTANPNWASDANILGAYIDILGSFDNSITNSSTGQIIGGIKLDAGNDTMVNAGSITATGGP